MIADLTISMRDGLLFVTKLRNYPLAASISVVLVTAVNLIDVIIRAKAVGFKHLLGKSWEQQSTDIIFAQAI